MIYDIPLHELISKHSEDENEQVKYLLAGVHNKLEYATNITSRIYDDLDLSIDYTYYPISLGNVKNHPLVLLTKHCNDDFIKTLFDREIIDIHSYLIICVLRSDIAGIRWCIGNHGNLSLAIHYSVINCEMRFIRILYNMANGLTNVDAQRLFIAAAEYCRLDVLKHFSSIIRDREIAVWAIINADFDMIDYLYKNHHLPTDANTMAAMYNNMLSLIYIYDKYDTRIDTAARWAIYNNNMRMLQWIIGTTSKDIRNAYFVSYEEPSIAVMAAINRQLIADAIEYNRPDILRYLIIKNPNLKPKSKCRRKNCNLVLSEFSK